MTTTHNHTLKISKHKPSILQGSLQFQVGKPRTALAYELPFEQQALSVLTFTLVALVAAYLYFVASSVLNVMGRAEAERSAKTTAGELAVMEQQYLTLSQSVSPESATALGLTPVQQVAYVYRPGNAALATTARGDM